MADGAIGIDDPFEPSSDVVHRRGRLNKGPRDPVATSDSELLPIGRDISRVRPRRCRVERISLECRSHPIPIGDGVE